MRWTKEQKQAIDDRNCNLLVSAAAGSGKTAVLVQRIIDIIVKDKIDINKLLIVTFTRAAAGEMRQRIQNVLSERIENKQGDERYLRKQLSLLNKAFITTMHSFCIDVVRKNFHLLDIDPGFRIADTTEVEVLKKEAVDEILEKEYEDNEESFISLVESFSSNRNDERLVDIILRLYSFIQSSPNPRKWLEDSIDMFNIEKNQINNNIWVKEIKNDLRYDLSKAQDLLEEALKLCNMATGPTEYEDAIKDDLKNVEELTKALDLDIDNFYENANSIKHSRFSSIRGKRKEVIDEQIKNEVKDIRDKYKTIIRQIKESSIEGGMNEYVNQLNNLRPIMNKLKDIVFSFSDIYMDKKLDRGILDFNDLEHFAIKALEDKDVRETYKKKFEYIFIDEYQDSNLVQETITNNIKKEKNLFMVGDVKQSIYRFRLADPTLFLRKYSTYHKDLNSANRRIDLSKNFRSRDTILSGINYIFKNIMSTDLGEVEYTEDAYLYKGLTFKPINDSKIELNIIEKNSSELELDEELKEMSYIEVEARIIAQKIKFLLGTKTYDAKNNEYRDIKYRDIVVLLRSTKSWMPVFEDVFIKEGIPLYTDSGAGYFDTLEIKVFMNFLKIIDNRRQDIPLLSVMRSSIGKFTINELIDIRLKNKGGSYYDAIVNYTKDMKDKLSNKLRVFLKDIDKWSEQARYLKLDEFIWRLLIDTGFYHYVGAVPGGRNRQANLRILVDRANQFEKTSVNGLFNFIRFIDRLYNSSGDMGTAKTLGENENVVRIMSIHKSKGLEFPVVIVGGLGKKFNLRDTYEDILLHRDLGLGPKYVDVDNRIYGKTLPQIAMKKKMKVESLSEEMRILYVAFTRAVDRLILVGSVGKLENECRRWKRGPKTYNLIDAQNYLDWICSVLYNHKDGKVLRELVDVCLKDNTYENYSSWKINIYNRENIETENLNDSLTEQQFRSKLENFKNEDPTEYKSLINNKLNWQYKHSNSIKIPSKISVTEIKQASFNNIDGIGYRIPTLADMPQFAETNKNFTGAEKGTIMHFVMQHLNLNYVNTQKDIEEQIDNFVIRELITKEESEVVNVSKILNFFESSIGKRMLSSDNIKREVPFVLRKKATEVITGLQGCNEDILIQGIIDCCFIENGYYVLLDYKTDDVYKNNTQRIVNIYKYQIRLYKEALERITSKTVKESYIYLFDIDKEIKVI